MTETLGKAPRLTLSLNLTKTCMLPQTGLLRTKITGSLALMTRIQLQYSRQLTLRRIVFPADCRAGSDPDSLSLESSIQVMSWTAMTALSSTTMKPMPKIWKPITMSWTSSLVSTRLHKVAMAR